MPVLRNRTMVWSYCLQAFIAKKWPEYELRGLTARELAGGKVILPVWHNVTQADVLKFSPPLADKLAVQTSESYRCDFPVEFSGRFDQDLHPDIERDLHTTNRWMELRPNLYLRRER